MPLPCVQRRRCWWPAASAGCGQEEGGRPAVPAELRAWEREHCQLQLQPHRWEEGGGWWCSCSIGQEMLMENRNNSNCMVVGGNTSNIMSLELVTVLLVKSLPVKSLFFFPFLFFVRTQKFFSLLCQGRQYSSVLTGSWASQHFPAKPYQRKKSSKLYPLPMG